MYISTVSKVRSLTLDNWTQAMVDNMVSDNKEFNKVWEYHVDPAFMKPTAKTMRSLRNQYIVAKYGQCLFHEDNHKRMDPVFASADYDSDHGGSCSSESLVRKQTVGMVAYSGIIQIHAISANQLPKADLLSDSDPYVVFSNGNGQSVRTKIIKDNNDPIWNEHLILSVNEREPISVIVFDDNKTKKDSMLCSATLDIGLSCEEGVEATFTHFPMTVDRRWKKQKKGSTLCFSVTYDKMDAQ